MEHGRPKATRRDHRSRHSLDENAAPLPLPSHESESRGPPTPRKVVVTKLYVLVARVIWFILGPVGLFLALWAILDAGHAGLARHDLLFACLAALTIMCRWIEQRSGQATTGTGDPATWADFRRYVRAFVLTAAAGWGLVRVWLLVR